MFAGLFILGVVFAVGAEIGDGTVREERDVWQGGHGHGHGHGRGYGGGYPGGGYPGGGKFHGPPGDGFGGPGRHGFYPPGPPHGGFGKGYGGNFPNHKSGADSVASADAGSVAGGGGVGGNSGASVTAGGLGGASKSQANSQTATFEFGPLTATFTNNQASASSTG